MAKCYCPCGAKYKVPDASVGKKARCKKCGDVFKLKEEDSGPIAIADDPFGLGGEIEAAMERAAEPVASSAAGVTGFDPSKLPPPIIEKAPASKESGSYGAFLADLGRSLAFVVRPSSLIIFVVIWGLLSVGQIFLPFAPCIGIIGIGIIRGWYCAFRFEVIHGAASGERDLPDFSLTGGVWDDIIAPFLKWVGSWIVVSIPAIVVLILSAQAGIVGFNAIPTNPDLSTAIQWAVSNNLHYYLGALLIGTFIWPIVVLGIAVAGFDVFGQFHSLIIGMVRAFPGYLIVIAIVFGASFLLPAVNLADTGITGVIIAIGLGVYLEIVGLRAIGLFYHHFKDKFPYDWG